MIHDKVIVDKIISVVRSPIIVILSNVPKINVLVSNKYT